MVLSSSSREIRRSNISIVIVKKLPGFQACSAEVTQKCLFKFFVHYLVVVIVVEHTYNRSQRKDEKLG